MWNREIRKIDLKKINFAEIEEQIIDDDLRKQNTVKDVTSSSMKITN